MFYRIKKATFLTRLLLIRLTLINFEDNAIFKPWYKIIKYAFMGFSSGQGISNQTIVCVCSCYK